MKDFSLQMYRKLVAALKAHGYQFQCLEDFIKNPQPKVAIIRHDVDLRGITALRFAEMESELGIRATYNFRITKQSFIPEVIKRIAELGHEIGYHYEDLTMANGDMSVAIQTFQRNLERLRAFYPITTICMHGRSMSIYDNRSMWSQYNYHDYGIIAEPYFDIDYDKVLYLTDTAQRWNGSKIALRDKVISKYDFSFTTTKDILDHIDNIPDQLLFTIHPDRWTDNIIEWLGIRCFVTIHNFVKVNYLNKRAQAYQAKHKN